MDQARKREARILVVDDEPQNVRYVTDVLEWAGYERVEGLTDPIEAVSRFEAFDPDLVILDLLMPEMDGFEVMDAMRRRTGAEVYLPFLILTSDISSESRRRALSGGAKDFLTKPMSPTEVRLRVDNLLETRFLYLECASQARNLQGREAEDQARQAAGDAEEELLDHWSAAIDAGLPVPEGRSRRVAWMAARTAEKLGQAEEAVELLRRAALLHDLGARAMTAVSAAGAGRTTYESILSDPQAGARLLEGSRLPVLGLARRILEGLDERWDGGGPGGLRGEAIPLEARIVAVARTWDDLTSGDPSLDRARELEAEAGSRLDPAVVAAFLQAHAVGA